MGVSGGQPGEEEFGTMREFAERLTDLRVDAGLTIRDLAKAVGVPTSTLGDYFAGRHLPPTRQPELLPELLRACGVVGEREHRSWTDGLRRLRQRAGRGAGAATPYRGLASFRPEDAEWFFGREELVGTLISRLGEMIASGAGGPLCVVGPSGSGKSSLLQAGLVPALRGGRLGAAGSGSAEERPVVLFTPGPHPMRQLQAQLGALPDHPARPVAPIVIVDQFEEVFTTCRDSGEREEFTVVLDALTRTTEPAVVVVGLRADFYGQALRHPALARALQESQVVVGPMTRDQLRQAIERPALKARTLLGEGLVELLLRDLIPLSASADGDRPTHDTGALPLLSHALLATWSIGRRGRLTVDDYHSSGGIRDAVARTAETVYAELSAPEQDLARRMFLRMVHIAEGTADTRRRIPRDDLGAAEAVAARFIDQRLVTADVEYVEITHEALLTAWPRLRNWLDADRAGLLTHRRLTDAADAWTDSGRDPGTLYRGLRLANALEWSADPAHGHLTPREEEFLAASRSHEEAEREAARRQVRRRRRLVVALSLTVVMVGILAVYSLQQQRQAEIARRAALSRQAATEAGQLRANDTALAAQLSVAAYRTSRTPEALGALLDTYVAPEATRAVGPGGVMETVAVTADGRTMATGGDSGAVRLWHVPARGAPRALGGYLRPGGAVYSAAFSPDGRTLAVGGAQGVTLWRVADPAHPVRSAPLPGDPAGTVYAVAFSPDGRLLAAGGADHRVRLWGLSGAAAGAVVLAVLSGATDAVHTVVFGPDGRTLAAGGSDRRVRLWGLADPRHPSERAVLGGPRAEVRSLAFSPDGRTLAAGDVESSVRLWRLSGTGVPAPLGKPLTGPESWVSGLRFSPDGRRLAASSSDNQVWLWDFPGRTLLGTLPHPGPVTALAFLDGGHRLATSAADGVARVWNLDRPVLPGASGRIFSLLFLGHGTLLAGAAGPSTALWRITDPRRPAVTGAALNVPAGLDRWSGAAAAAGDLLALGGHDGTVHLWRRAPSGLTTALPTVLTGPHSTVEAIAISPDRGTLAVGADDAHVFLWDISRPSAPRRLGSLYTGKNNYVMALAFSARGHLLAAGGVDRKVRLWNLADPAAPRPLGSPLTGPRNYVNAVAFGPDGHTLAAGSADGTVRLWDVSAPAAPRPDGAPLTGPRNYVYAVAFSPDGHTLAAAGGDGTVHLWSIPRPGRATALATLTASSGGVFAVAFDRDSGMLATAGADSSVRLWVLDPARVSAYVCETAGTPVSAAEWEQYMPGADYRPPC
ncbi:helix-turn-helix domain-containing protein [Streptomyces sp. NBC_01537]|uniref:nSTAND1 domain-containing NTPase n=1 Tax=Streptomyces sp. NBC_01537 TaxID=2903896 RepID=UPI00386FC24E